ncbi:IS4 family transposase [Stieleria varia]|nr:IS4 family transposase [Stieleria varia]
MRRTLEAGGTEVRLMVAVDLGGELQAVQFGDERLSKRAIQIAERLQQSPNASIPAAMGTKNELDACYEFFDNPKVTQQKILQPHIEATYRRIEQTDSVVCAQDTSEIDLTRPKQQVQGAGPMDCESRRGAFFHPVVAFNLDGVALGLLGQKTYVRETLSTLTPSQKTDQRRRTPIEEKESIRWLEGLTMTHQAALACPETICVCVGDSEADIYELFVAKSQIATSNLHILVRAGQNRNTTDREDWKDQVRRSPVVGEQVVNLRARTAKVGIGKSARSRSREARTAQLEIRTAVVDVARPIHASKDLLASGRVNVVLCEEVNVPEGEDPICWMLVTTLPIDTEQDVQRVIRCYCIRWQIEVFFKTLKSGCRIEHRRFEEIDRIKNALAMYAIVAWRLMYICHMGRSCPDVGCEIIFEPSEWKSVYAILGAGNP